MIEPPDLSGAAILSAVRISYDLPVTDLVFLPIGNDASAWAYRLQGAEGTRYFLKVRRGINKAASLAIPRYLHDHGMPHIVAPMLTQSQKLWTGLADYTLVLYAFIDGHTGMEFGLS